MMLLSIFLNCLLIAVVVWLFFRFRHQSCTDVQTPVQMEEESQPDKQRIMLVGMDDGTEADLKACLQEDYDLVFVKSGQQAIDMIADLRVDLIVSEFLMQEMSGDEFCHALREGTETARVPVVFLSALSHSADIVYGLEAGAKDYITKPYDVTILKARIRMVLDESRRPVSGDPEHAQGDPHDLEFLQRLDRVIRKQLSNSDLQINDICTEMGMSRTAFFTKVKAVTGHSPNDYLRIFRLNEAKRLLEARLWTVAEVAVKVGYNDPKYFSTSFKKQFGVSPSKMY